MKNELRARLAYAMDVSEARRMGLRSRLEKLLADDRPANGDPQHRFAEERDRDKCEHELELAEEWCSATRALVLWLQGELLGESVPEDFGESFYARPQQPGLQVADDPKARVR